MKRQQTWYTLVELITVITVITILALVSYLSLSLHQSNARDAVRLSSVWEIVTNLELSRSRSGILPVPDQAMSITHSGALLWQQGVFGTSVLQSLSWLSEVPKDPLTGSHYVYSLVHDGSEYQVIGALERGDAINSIATGNMNEGVFARSLVRWNYNGVLMWKKVKDKLLVISSPSLVTSLDNSPFTELEIFDIFERSAFVVGGFSAVPWSLFSLGQGGSEVVGLSNADIGSFVVFYGSPEELGSASGAISLAQKIEEMYSDTELRDIPEIARYTLKDTGEGSMSNWDVYRIFVRLLNINSIADGIKPFVARVLND